MAVVLNFYHMGMSNREVALRFMGIYEAQFRGLQQAGATVRFSLDRPDSTADYVIVTANEADIQRAAADTDRLLILYVPPVDQWFAGELLVKFRDRILFAYGPVLSETTTAAYRDVGIDYHDLPFAADPDLMRPLNLPAQYDVVFLGGLQHRRGYQPYIEPLLKKIDRQRLLFIGGGWEKYGIPIQSIAYGPLVNVLYNLARVCINFHAPEQCRGMLTQLDVNNRVFDLAMAGCVQVSDNPEAIHRHFAPTELFAEPTPDAWVARVLDCLARPDNELAPRRAAARARALTEHTWMHRGRTFLSWIDQHAQH
jgi:spore maturation protein CgeB